MKRIFITLILIAIAIFAEAQSITNANFETKDKKIEITYNITNVKKGQKFNITLWYSVNNGTYRQITNNITGDYGTITASYSGNLTNRKIIWNPLAAQKKLQAAIQFEVRATVTDAVPDNMVLVQGGTFQMGADGVATPVHSVTVSSFYMSKYEVTNEEFCKFLNAYGSDKVKSGSYSGQSMINLSGSWKDEKCRIYKSGSSYNVSSGYTKYPVIYVTWYGANEYCKWLSQTTGKTYRLPTEAEWEYAAGNGNRHTKYSWGNGEPSGKNGGNVADETAKKSFSTWTIFDGYTDGYVYVAPVGKFNPNDFGLYDMMGNVWEWCSDWYSSDYYSNSPQTNPQGASSGSYRVLRGGSWYCNASRCRVAGRGNAYPAFSDYSLGFRLARVL